MTTIEETAIRCLDRALAAMNHAVELTRDHGPAVGMESIADFLNDSDGIDEEVADTTPDNWLTRWTVVDLTDARKAAEIRNATELADSTDARFTAAQREQLEVFEGADEAPETFDPIAALRRVEALAAELDERGDIEHADWRQSGQSQTLGRRDAYETSAELVRAALAPQEDR